MPGIEGGCLALGLLTLRTLIAKLVGLTFTIASGLITRAAPGRNQCEQRLDRWTSALFIIIYNFY